MGWSMQKEQMTQLMCVHGNLSPSSLTGVGFLQIHLGGVRLGRPGGEGGQGRNSKFKYMY
jgi:hypothetical protein